jgi:hypothetical protein
MSYLLFIFIAFSRFETPDRRKIKETNNLEFDITSSQSHRNLHVIKPDDDVVVIRHELSKALSL